MFGYLTQTNNNYELRSPRQVSFADNEYCQCVINFRVSIRPYISMVRSEASNRNKSREEVGGEVLMGR